LDNLTSEYDDWFAIEKEYINCIKDTMNDNFSDLPSIPNYNEPQIIIPPQPDEPPDYPSNLPYIPPPGITIFIIPDGGTLLCNRIVDPCTGEILEKTRNQICFPTSCSDVPGKIKLLCWSGREPIYFPKVKRTYGTTGNKWPVNAILLSAIKPLPPVITSIFNVDRAVTITWTQDNKCLPVTNFTIFQNGLPIRIVSSDIFIASIVVENNATYTFYIVGTNGRIISDPSNVVSITLNN
jgi:hypothetical protein